VSASDFEQDDALDELSSDELEEQAFGPDPDRKRRRGRRARRKAAKSAPPPAAVPARVASAPVALATLPCAACGEEVDVRAEACPACGAWQPEVSVIRRRAQRGGPKSKGTATLLALCLGGVGAHRFYLGQWKIGLAMLALCWTFLPVLVGVVDFVRLAFMSDLDFADRYERTTPRRQVGPAAIRRLGRKPVQLGHSDDDREESR